jgi:hypothetical protein
LVTKIQNTSHNFLRQIQGVLVLRDRCVPKNCHVYRSHINQDFLFPMKLQFLCECKCVTLHWLKVKMQMKDWSPILYIPPCNTAACVKILLWSKIVYKRIPSVLTHNRAWFHHRVSKWPTSTHQTIAASVSYVKTHVVDTILQCARKDQNHLSIAVKTVKSCTLPYYYNGAQFNLITEMNCWLPKLKHFTDSDL